MMNPLDAVKSVLLENYANFNGRAPRSEFWWFVLFSIIVSIPVSMIHGYANLILFLAFFVPSIAVTARRLHDWDKSGWLQLLMLIPIVGFIWYIVLGVMGGTPGDNKYGPNPLDGGNSGFSPTASDGPTIQK